MSDLNIEPDGNGKGFKVILLDGTEIVPAFQARFRGYDTQVWFSNGRTSAPTSAVKMIEAL